MVAQGRPAHGGRDRHVAVGVKELEVLESALKNAGRTSVGHQGYASACDQATCWDLYCAGGRVHSVVTFDVSCFVAAIISKLIA